MATTYNGWQVVPATSTREWAIPGSGISVTSKIRLLNHPAGFVLACFLSWFSENVERLAGKVLDDWGWAPVRVGRGQSSGTSNHCSATAVDVNATKHVQYARDTFTLRQRARILLALRFYYRVLGWGGTWRSRDEMHFEIKPGVSRAVVIRAAFKLAKTPRGKRVLVANPGAHQMLRKFA